MVISISALSEPVGSIKSWIRPDAAVPLPGGWLICDGTTVVDSSSAFDSLAIPDLRSKFPRGHATLTNANFSADVNYFTGGTVPTGGVDSIDNSHTHSAAAHTHTIPNHTHAIAQEPAHNHTGAVSGDIRITPSSNDALLHHGNDGINWVHFHTIPTQPAHAHGFVTGSTALGTNSGGGSTNSALGVNENRPVFDELLLIIKIK